MKKMNSEFFKSLLGTEPGTAAKSEADELKPKNDQIQQSPSKKVNAEEDQVPWEKQLEMCIKAWKGTLEKFGIDRPILPFENMKISRLIKAYDWKSVMYALTGARFESKTQSFDPSQYVSLSRVEQPHLFERYVNLSAQQMAKQKKIDKT